MGRRWGSYGLVLASAVACYSALGAALGVLPGYVGNGLHANPIWIGLTVGAPSLTGAILRPLGGRFADRRGPRRVMVAGAVLMAVGIAPAIAPELFALVVSRLIVGAGEAVMMSAAVLWLLRLAGPRRQALSLGHIGLANYAGLTAGPLLAPPLGGAQHPGGVWLAAAALPLLAVAGVARVPVPDATTEGRRDADMDAMLWRVTLRPGVGLLLVNVGYVAVLAFGAAALSAHHLPLASAVIPVFAVGVIVSRTALGVLPDRFGPARTLLAAAAVEGVGLAVFGLTGSLAIAVTALIVLSLGQGLAVPSLGALALEGVPPQRRGAAAGAFFAYFDAGVGLGGPLTGALTHAFSASVALVGSGVAVGLAAPTALWRRRRRALDPYAGTEASDETQNAAMH